MKIEVHCDDGSDRNCFGHVEVDLPYSGLTNQDITVNWIFKNGRQIVDSVSITPPSQEWENNLKDSLSPADIESIAADGYFNVNYSALEHRVCGACGSSQTYNAEGENIS